MTGFTSRRVAALLLGVAATLVTPQATSAATFPVTDAGDSGGGSLRAAIQAANANGNPDVVDRIELGAAVVGKTIELESALPILAEPVTIAGCASDSGRQRPCIGLRAKGPVVDFAGLTAAAPNVTIEGLAITNTTSAIAGQRDLLAVYNSWLGMRLDGTPEGNDTGVVFQDFIAARIGGPGSGEGNVIVDNGVGIEVRGARGSRIQGNLIGTDASGAELGNGSGIWIHPSELGQATLNQVGGDTFAEENVISYNRDAILIDGDASSVAYVFRNRGGGNAGPFIDLAPPVGPGNDPFDGPNDRIQPPLISAATTESVSGQLARPGATVRVFRRALDEAGRIDAFVGQTTANGAGIWRLSYPPLPPGQFLVASQTPSANAGTSELTASFAYEDVTARPGEPASPTEPAAPPSPGTAAPGQGPAPAAAADAVAPALTRVSLLRSAFRVGRAPTPVSARRRAPAGTAFRFTLSEPATVRIAIERAAAGRRIGRACRRPARRLRARRRCTRWLRSGALSRGLPAGRASVRFSGASARAPCGPAAIGRRSSPRTPPATAQPRGGCDSGSCAERPPRQGAPTPRRASAPLPRAAPGGRSRAPRA